MTRIPAEEILPTLKRYMLVDGYEFVLDIEKSKGQYIHDALTKRKYLDLFGFHASAPIGHNHPGLFTPEFTEKLLRVARIKPSNSDLYTEEMAEFVTTFSRIVQPDYLPHLFLISGGTLAVENALKTAFDWKVRKNFAKGHTNEVGHQVIHFQEAFHGRSGYTLSMTNTADPRKIKYFTCFEWPRIVNPKITFPLDEANLDKVMSLENKAVTEIKQAFSEYGDDIAAIIIEPIQGEGGDNHFRPEFLSELRQLADENEALLIFDEIQTGVGLTGEMWAHQGLGVKPDILVFGKKTQVCGILAGERIDEVEDNVFQEGSRLNSTWGGNLVDMVRSQRYLEIIKEDNLVMNARRKGTNFLERLQKLVQEIGDGIASNVRGRGLMIAFDLPNTKLRDEFLELCFQNGLLTFGCGSRSVRFRPMLDIEKVELNKALYVIEKSLRELIALHKNDVVEAA
ncbi:L-lysine 6-transaminase [candidate division KSB1 bacterium]|nr:L-lysine 6-transaminase [candidate division KSB1 bacterium]NIR72768.1 L-lysine 6-transaminase [candidate division KSB1 bacterium]NIS23724.1 L-lysine 6-transaminase [candidate division KSB1 bacterium]NIT70644.1 L-lysine 6-transaminase [candidate division KSB1 bacterium]NIU24372.1 L-lysine 6-transaminase [candidate division KSB1 bacterium]